MERSEAYQRGAALRRQLQGDEYTAQRDQSSYADPATQKFIDAATELVFGQIWTRPGLDLKTRSLVVLTADAAAGREELDVHLRMALRQGWTEEEVCEVFIQLLGYVGAPLIRQAFLRAQPVFAEFRTQG
jgi:4-carboxymuconolactone decarboxylase